MKNKSPALLLLTFLFLSPFSISQSMAAEFQSNGNFRITDYLYDQLDRYYGPPVKRANYFLQQATINTFIKEGMTTGVIQLYLNNLDQNNQPTGGYTWGSSGGYGSNIRLDRYIHQAYLEIPAPGVTFSAGRRLIKLGEGIILNDTADHLFLNFTFSIFNLDLAYLKLIEPDAVNYGNPDDFDKNGYLINLKTNFNERDWLELFYLQETQKATGLMISDTNALALGIVGSGRAGEIDWKGEFDSISGHDGNFGVNLPRVGTNLYLTGSTKLSFGRVGVDLLYVKGKRSTDETSYNSFAGDFVGGHGILLNDQTRFGGGVDLNSGMVDMGDPTTLGYWHFLSHNFTSIKAFVEFNPYKKLTLLAEIFPYVLLNDRGVLTVNNVAVTHEKIGMEGNITGIYPIDEHLKISAGSAYFKAGDLLREIATDTQTPAFGQNILKTYLSLQYTF